MKNPAFLKICLLTFITMSKLRVYRIVLVVFFGLITTIVQGQYYYLGMDRTIENRVYTDLRVALQVPDIVMHVDLSNRRLTEWPNELYNFPNLRSIKLKNNQLTKVEIKTNTFHNVVSLDLSNNQISEFTIEKNSLSFLKELNLDNNKLLFFPQLGNYNFIVEDLSLRYNQIAYIPEGELYPSTLKFLYLDKNPIKNPEVIFKEGNKLEELYLCETGLKQIPANTRLNNLQKLNLGNNPFDFSSFKAENFPNVLHLDLSYINLENESPFEELKSIKNLKYLSLEACSIKEIRSVIASMKKLREISLLGNEISQFPNEFYDLKLKLINLQRNPLNNETKQRLQSEFKKSTVHLD